MASTAEAGEVMVGTTEGGRVAGLMAVVVAMVEVASGAAATGAASTGEAVMGEAEMAPAMVEETTVVMVEAAGAVSPAGERVPDGGIGGTGGGGGGEGSGG